MRFLLLTTVLIHSTSCFAQQDSIPSFNGSGLDLVWSSANGRKKPMAFFSNQVSRYSYGVLEERENTLHTNLFFISNGWGTSGEIGWHELEGQSITDINSFFNNPKGEKAFYNQIKYLELVKRNSDHDVYNVENRGRRVGILKVFVNKLEYRIYPTKGYPDTNLIIEYKGKFQRLQ